MLFRADRKPFERSGVVFISVFPVIVGPTLATAYGAWVGYIRLGKAIRIWLFQLVLVFLFSTTDAYARKTLGNADRVGGSTKGSQERLFDISFPED